jgi:hypothetical protein
MKFRKKPIVIDAINWDGTQEARDKLFKFGGLDKYNSGGELLIHTLEGIMTSEIGDWVIKGIKGEFYPCKPDIFEKTYEKVED